MSEFNPYAAPQAKIIGRDGLRPETGEFWQDGSLLVIRKGCTFPDICVKCAAPAEGFRLKRTLSWHKPLWYLVILINIILYILVAMLVRKTAKVAIPLCREHRARRRNTILLGWGGSLLGLFIAIFGGSNAGDAAPIAVVGGALLFLVSLLYGVIRSQVLVPKKIDKEFAWLKKAGPEFLAPLPIWEEGADLKTPAGLVAERPSIL